MDKFIFVSDATPFDNNKRSNPRGPRPKVCDRCNIRKIKCTKGIICCKQCEKYGLECTYDRRNKSNKSDSPNKIKDNLKKNKLENEFIPTSLITYKGPKIKILNQHSAYIPSNKGLWSKYFLNGNGEQFYIGNSMANFYFSSNSYMLANKTTPMMLIAQTPFQDQQDKKTKNFKISSVILFQLIKIYFARINNPFPTVNEKAFFDHLSKKNNSPSFLALLFAVCLCGTSFYPDMDYARDISLTFSELFLFYLHKCIRTPNPLVIQACIITSYHINLSASDPVLGYCWQLIGIAHRMCSQLGLHLTKYPKFIKNKKALKTTCGIGTAAEVILGFCFGRSYFGSYLENILSDISILINKKDFNNESDKNNNGITKFIHHPEGFLEAFFQMMALLDKVNINIQPFSQPMVSKFSFSCILNQQSKEPLKEYESYKSYIELENLTLKWYSKYICPTGKGIITVKNITKQNEGILILFYLSLLIDLNRPFIASSHQITFIKDASSLENNLTISEFRAINSLEKVFYVSLLGTQLLKMENLRIIEDSLPLHWYAFLQYGFAFMLVLDKVPKEHWIVHHCKENLKFYYNLFFERSNQWVIMRDIFLVSKPFMKSYLK